MKKQAILCPGEGHDKFQKTLLFVGSREILAYCKLHGWVSIKFTRGGVPVSFDDCAISISKVEQKKDEKWISAKPAPTLSIGDFKKK